MTKNANNFAIETLEARQMLAGTPLNISDVAFNGGTQLKITGTAGNDQIVVTQLTDGIQITNTGGWTTKKLGNYKSILVDGGLGNDSVTVNSSINSILYGGAGNDTLIGGSGNDRIYGGAGNNSLSGNGGDDILVSIGGGTDATTGGAGNDSFWVDNAASEKVTDASSVENAMGAVHRITNFFSYVSGGKATVVSKELTGGNLMDPLTTNKSFTYKNFATNPLFSDAGPTANDVVQGQLGDCYFLSTLGSLAKVGVNHIKQSVVDLGDGTYAVDFKRGGTDTFVRVDGDLPVWTGTSTLAYANTGAQKSLWVAIMEKAYAFFRSSVATYASLAGGWMANVYGDLGMSSKNILGAVDEKSLLATIQSDLAAGKSMTFATTTTVSSDIPMVGSHAYMIDHVNYDADGKAVSVTLRNPWGVDGYSSKDGANDGYVTLTGKQLQACFGGICSATM